MLEQALNTQPTAADLAELAQNFGIKAVTQKAKTPFTPENIIQMAAKENLPNEYYHKSPDFILADCTVPINEFLSGSKLKEAVTPHILAQALAKEATNKQRENFNNGSAIHAMIADPANFEYEIFDEQPIIDKLIAAGSKSPRATKEYKEWAAQYMNEDGELRENVLKKHTFQSMWRTKNKIKADPLAVLIKNSLPEVSIFCEFEEVGAVKIRPDMMCGVSVHTIAAARDLFGTEVKIGDLVYISVKSTIDADPMPGGFERQARNMAYDVAEALYVDILQAADPERKIWPVFLVIEKNSAGEFTGAYNWRRMSEQFLEAGRAQMLKNLKVWQAYTSGDRESAYEFIYNTNVFDI